VSFNCDFGVFPAKPPWFVAKIYPFLGFISPLEYYQSSYSDANEPYAYGTFSRNPLLRSVFPTAFWRKKVSIKQLLHKLPGTSTWFGYHPGVHDLLPPQALFHA
jgi:hypothetical protein